MILLWGVPGDPPLDAVHRALVRLGAPTLVVDQRRPEATTLTIEVSQHLTGTLRVGPRIVELDKISGFYLRPQDRATLPTPRDGQAGDAASIGPALDDALLIVAELAAGTILNRPDAMAANGSKPYQYRQIRGVGFNVPDTLITTSPDAARQFVERHGCVIYKSVSGVRSVVGELREAEIARLSEVCWCPTQLQERIAGIDVRVHVVGDALFACEVRSDAVDYRYAHLTGQSVQLSRCQLPDECAARCVALARASDLPLAGIDLRRTEEGEWYCFEINPSPGFTYYQHATGAPIDAAIAKLLTTFRPASTH
jgi:glutathione synthase/RimK-type ligase-like ATP-grasp enzyme